MNLNLPDWEGMQTCTLKIIGLGLASVTLGTGTIACAIAKSQPALALLGFVTFLAFLGCARETLTHRRDSSDRANR